MKLLQWFAGIGTLGIGMIVVGALGMTQSRDGLTVGGSLIVASVVVSMAILAAAKK